MKTKRDKVFIWPSWISKLVAGEEQCEWKYWFKAHYKVDKSRSTDYSLATWCINHTKLIKSRRDELEALGYVVTLEDQNSFYYTPPGKTYTISGKADLVAVYQEPVMPDGMVERVLVEDAKTGKCKTSDFVQVLFYMYMLPVAHKLFKGFDFAGTVVYKGIQNQPVPSAAKKDMKLKNNIWATINQIAGDESDCRRVPSWNECKRCDICRGDCASRMGD